MRGCGGIGGCCRSSSGWCWETSRSAVSGPSSAGSLAFPITASNNSMARYRQLHAWDVTPAEAQAIQNRLRAQVRVEPLEVDHLKAVAGADLSFDRGSDTV